MRDAQHLTGHSLPQLLLFVRAKQLQDRTMGRQQAVCLDEECEGWSSVGLHNKCTMTDSQAGADFTMTVLLLLMYTVVAVVQNKASNKMDESKQTAQDYSVMVDDPGPMDDDPEKWREFFSQFGHVTFITIARDNGPL